MGAGVIPFCIRKGNVHFLFQRVFLGRKSGFLNDFGGGVGEGESYQSAAMREFVEETETMFFADDIHLTQRNEETIEAQLPIMRELFEKTLTAHPHWWCSRITRVESKPKDWCSYFVEFAYRELSAMNREWELDGGRRFKKRRELVWIEADELLKIYADEPKRLWKRVRQLDGAEKIIQQIRSVSLQP